MKKIGVVDYDAGNLKSVETALRHIGAHFFISSKPEELEKADKILFPGVGHAVSAMNNLRSRGLDSLIQSKAIQGFPVFGICIGSQIILDSSEEGPAETLGIIEGKARLFIKKGDMKIPHMGWNTVSIIKNHYLFNGIADNSSFYFVHSYYPDPASIDYVMAETVYGETFASALCKDNVIATQFHPEKSGEPGLQILRNFSKF